MPAKHENGMCVRVWFEIGHSCTPSSSNPGKEGNEWRVWVRGAGDIDISPYVYKVVFYLQPPDQYHISKRIVHDPPYEIKETGFKSLDITIHIYLRQNLNSMKIRLKYNICPENSDTSVSKSTFVHYDIENPSDCFLKLLKQGGAQVIARTNNVDQCGYPNNHPVVILSEDDGKKRNRSSDRKREAKKQKLQSNARAIKPYLDKFSSPCGDSAAVDFGKILEGADMTDDEVKKVSDFYAACSSYESSENGIKLPPLDDPIYSVPELPPSLRSAMRSIEADYAML